MKFAGIPPFLVEGRHDTLKKVGIWSRGHQLDGLSWGHSLSHSLPIEGKLKEERQPQ